MSNAPGASTPAAASETVRNELAAILGSPEFVNSPRLSGFLKYVVEESLAGRAANLKEYQIGLDVFGRPESFDPKSDPVVRVEARQLRFKLTRYYEGRGSEDGVVISVPKGAYAAHFETLAKAPTPATPPEIPAASRKSHILAAVIFVALCAIGAWFWIWVNRATANPSVVILPFTNMSGDPANDYLTDGLTDGLTGALSRVKTLRVIAGPSAAAVKSTNDDVHKIGRMLDVASVLQGDVARQSEKVRITARLLRTSDGSIQWTRTWEGAVGQMYLAQAEIAAGVARAMRVSSRPDRPVTTDPVAQDYYLRARYEADQLTRSGLESAIQHYELAVKRDPGYAAAWYGLAVAKHRWPAYVGDGEGLDREAVEGAYRKAIETDPEFAEPHTGLALIAMQQDWDWGRAEQELTAANAIAPTAIAESHLAFLKLLQGKRVEMAEHIRRARDLDPLGAAVLMNTAEIQMLAGEFAAAREVADRFAGQHPDVPAARALAAYSLIAEGKADEALKRLVSLKGRIPGIEVFEAMAHARAGRGEEARRVLAGLERNSPKGLACYSVAQAYGYLGDEVSTLAWLGRSAEARESLVPNAAVDPAFVSLRGRAGFREFLRRLRLGE
jgi:TolB-like protein